MKYLLVTIDTYAGDHHQNNNHIAKCEDGQKPNHVADAVAKSIFGSDWDESCSGFNTDCYLWHSNAGVKEITEEKYNQLVGYLDAYIFTDAELAEIQEEIENAD